jgi:hypothetical protein
MEARYQVLGCKGFKGEVEGTSYDSTTLYVVFPVSRRLGTEAGFNVREVKFGKEEEYQKLKQLPFPVMVDLEIEVNTKGVECFGFRSVTVSPGHNAPASPANPKG